jgi:type I restriction enzyme S subunit
MSKHLVPKGWKTRRLGDIGSTFNGLTGKNKENFGKGKPYIPYKNIFSNPRIRLNNLDFVEILENDNQNKVQAGDFFFTTSSETPDEVGMGAVLLEEPREVYLNSFCFGYRLANHQELLPEFGVYLIRGNQFRDEMKFLAQGSTRYNISKGAVLEIEISLPPLNEQKKIAEILSSADRVIELTSMEIEKLKDLKKGMMQELLTKGIGHTKFKDSPVGKIPEGWDCVSLASTVNEGTVITYGIVQAGPHIEGGVPYIKTGDMSGDSIELSKLQRTSREVAAKFKRSEVSEGDIVLSLRGNIGKVMLVSKAISGANLTQGTAKISVKADISSRYILWALRSGYIAEQYRNVVKGTTFQEITLGDLRELKICIPPSQEREKIVSLLQSIEDNIDLLKLKSLKYEDVKKGLMNDLLTGKVRVKV